jgi:hypothetical protein
MPNAIAVLCLLASPLNPACSATLATRDGLSLDLSARGRVTGLRSGKAALPLKGAGGFAIADFKDQPEPGNLVLNPGFEEGETGWRLANGQRLDTALAHSGKASVRLEVPGPEPASSSMEVFVPVKPNTRYRAGLWVRREQVGVCGAYVSERDDQNKLTGTQTQYGAAIPKEEGIWLPVTWDFTTQPATTRLSLRADIYRSTGTLWVDDYFVHEYSEGVYEPVEGTVQQSDGALTFKGLVPGRGLELEATFRISDGPLSRAPRSQISDWGCVRVEGVVRDTTGEDRAVGVRFALPLDLAGWTWFTDAEERETIEPGRNYRYTYRCVSGIGACSVYPWSALTGADAGLSLALPLSQGPRVFVIQHHQAKPETSITFFFGLAKDAGNNPSRAPFSFVLYRHDPAWGMRSAMERYYRLFPESFVKRPTFEGYLNYADLERFDPKTHRLVISRSAVEDASDFGEGYRFLSHLHGCYDFRQVPYDDPKLPSDETVFSLLRQMSDEEKTKPRSYAPTAETMKKIVFGPDGQISYIGDTTYWRANEGYNHTDKPGWGLNFRVNEDPGVSPFLADMYRKKAEEYAQDPNRRAWDATLTADAIEGYMANAGGLNFRREHFKTTLVPLTFGVETPRVSKDNLRPAMPNTIWDFHQQAWWPLTNEHKLATYGNANGYEQAFTLPFVDVPMTEGNWDPQHDGRLDRFMRGMAYQKIWRYWHAWDRGGGYGDKDPENVLRHFRRGLAYAIYPSVYCLESATADLEQYRAQFRQYVPAIEELSRSGWEPVPHARATEGVIVERFGSYAVGELHFTLRNYGDQPVRTTLTLDRKALGIPAAAGLLVSDILPGVPQCTAAPQDGLKVALDADGTEAIWIGTREQAAQHGFRLAAATLEKLERMFATEMGDDSRATWTKALKLAQEGAQAAGGPALALAEELQQALGALQRSLTTSSPVDLAKLIYRARTGASCAPAALLSLALDGKRTIENCPRGETATVGWGVTSAGRSQLTGLRVTVLSPWPEVAEKCAVGAVSGSVAAGQSVAINAKLFIPPDPPRRLMPFLLSVQGKPGGSPFTVAAPVDLVVGSPVTVSVQPERAFRGQERRVRLTVRNHLAAGKLTLRFTPPPKVKLTPAEVTVAVPAQAAVEQLVTLSLEQSVAIGELRIGYSVAGDDARFNSQGSVQFLVGDPVPQVAIKRVPAAPTVDGKLTDAIWQAPPLIPELRLLANGGPASEKTAVWATYDGTGLYVVFRCLDSQMTKLVAKYAERGSPLYLDDDIEVFVLPSGGKQVFQFAVNALGAQSDNFGNKAEWKAAAFRGETEWIVEVSIPYKALGLDGPPGPGLPWGVQFGRQQKAKGETTSWTPGPAFISKEGFGEVLFE